MNPLTIMVWLAAAQPDPTITLNKTMLYTMLDMSYCSAWKDAVEMQRSLYDIRRMQMGEDKRTDFEGLRGAMALPEKCPRTLSTDR